MLADFILHFNGIFATPTVKVISLPLLWNLKQMFVEGHFEVYKIVFFYLLDQDEG